MIHGAALKVLSNFNETSTLSFSELCERTGYATDLGGYYIRQLLAASCIVKTARGTYQITPLGKQHLIINAPKRTGTAITNPRFCVMALPIIDGKYIMMRRKRQPYIGYAEWPAGRVQAGEDLEEATHTVVQRRLGVTGELKFAGFFRRIDLQQDMVFDDKLFAVYEYFLESDTAFLNESDLGHNEALTAEEIEVVGRAPGALRDIMHFTHTPETYQEVRYQLTPEEISL